VPDVLPLSPFIPVVPDAVHALGEADIDGETGTEYKGEHGEVPPKDGIVESVGEDVTTCSQETTLFHYIFLSAVIASSVNLEKPICAL